MKNQLSRCLLRALATCLPFAVPVQAAEPLVEKLACISGPRDEQVRLTVLTVKGRPMEFAYYSRWGTRVCSIHGRRGDAYTKWQDESGRALVKLLQGQAELEYSGGKVKLTLDTVDRMTFCGMDGELNGTVEVAKAKSECSFAGVFELEPPAEPIALKPITETAVVEAPAAKAPAAKKGSAKGSPAKRGADKAAK
jgi:hypothetical protein